MWAVVYDDGMSLTTASEQIARSLAEAERQRGHRVTVRRVDDVQAYPPRPIGPPERSAEGSAERSAESRPISELEPVPAPETPGEPESARPVPQPRLTREPAPARARTPARRRRLLLYALAAVSILVAAALADHWGVLPRVGATTSSSPAQVGGPPPRPQLLPPLNQAPVMHFSNAVSARSKPRPPSATARGG
jgi:hypothetical protein